MEHIKIGKAEEFLHDVADHIYKLMEKEVHELHPKELDYIVALCDLHNEVCEFVELREKFTGKDKHPMGHMWEDPHKRR